MSLIEGKLLLTVADAARVLSMPEGKVRMLCASGEFGFKDGDSQKWSIHADDVVEYAERKRRGIE